jgi:hypothetical protein
MNYNKDLQGEKNNKCFSRKATKEQCTISPIGFGKPYRYYLFLLDVDKDKK